MTEKDITGKSLCQRCLNCGTISVSLLAAAAVLIFFNSIGLRQVRDYDDFWHLWSGRLIFETGAVPRADPILFSTAGLDWINLNWLAQLFNYRLFLSFGLAGPLGLGALLGAVILLCHLAILRRTKPALTPTVVSICLLLYAIRFTHGSRPQDYSFAFLALLNLLLRFSGDSKRISKSACTAIAGLLMLWDNIHGGVIFGYILLGCDILGSAVEEKRKSAANSLLTQRALSLAAAAIIGLCGYALHPHGLAALIHTATYSSSMRPIFYERIFELMPPSLLGLQGATLTAYAIGAAGLAVAVKRFTPLREAFFFVLFLCLSQSMQRFITPLLIVSLPLFTELFDSYWRKKFPKAPASNCAGEAAADRLCSTTAAVTALILLSWLCFFMPSASPDRTPGTSAEQFVDPKMFPVGAAKFIKSSNIPGRIFNEYGAGGYLGWVFYPEQRLYIDGRGDLISQGPVFDDYVKIVEVQPGFQDLLAKLGIDLLLMPGESKIAKVLSGADAGPPGVEVKRWQPIYRDKWFTLLRRPAD